MENASTAWGTGSKLNKSRLCKVCNVALGVRSHESELSAWYEKKNSQWELLKWIRSLKILIQGEKLGRLPFHPSHKKIPCLDCRHISSWSMGSCLHWWVWWGRNKDWWQWSLLQMVAPLLSQFLMAFSAPTIKLKYKYWPFALLQSTFRMWEICMKKWPSSLNSSQPSQPSTQLIQTRWSRAWTPPLPGWQFNS